MKKRLIQFALLLCLMALTCAAAQASESEGAPTSGFQNVSKQAAYQTVIDMTPQSDKGAAVALGDNGQYPGAAKMELTYKQAQQGQEYALFVLTDKNPPTADNIAYIDQKTADASGAVTFNIYPKKLPETSSGADYTVYMSSNTDANAGTGITTYTEIASFRYYAAATVKLGDVDEDTEVTAIDARITLQMASGIIEEKDQTERQKAAADVDKDTEVTAIDARMILQFASGILETFG